MKPNYVEITRDAFQKVSDGKQVDLYILRNSSGMVVKLTNQGAKIVQILVPDRNNQLGDVVLGYETADRYLTGGATFGAVVGRRGLSSCRDKSRSSKASSPAARDSGLPVRRSRT